RRPCVRRGRPTSASSASSAGRRPSRAHGSESPPRSTRWRVGGAEVRPDLGRDAVALLAAPAGLLGRLAVQQPGAVVAALDEALGGQLAQRGGDRWALGPDQRGQEL